MPPRSSDATAAIAASPVATAKTMTRPWWKGPDISDGKNSLPVSTCWLVAGKVARTPDTARRCCTGFTPSTAANSEDTGGSAPMCWATACGTPCACRPCVSVRGSVLASPAIISEKKTPIESAVPEFWYVERMPDAAPRYRAGTLLMIEAELGAANIPPPMPLVAVSRANAQ